MVEFRGKVEISNTATSSLLTKRTQEAFEGMSVEILLVAGKHGPFFHVSLYDFGQDPKAAAERYKKCAKFSRTNLLRKHFESIPPKDVINRKKLDLFMSVNEERIEMDPTFNLLDPLKEFFKPKHHGDIEKKFLKTSRERWMGLTKPCNLIEAHKLYYLPHLTKGENRKKTKYLYEIQLEVPDNIPNFIPVAHFGKVRHGSSYQLKLTNHAIECVETVRPLETWKP